MKIKLTNASNHQLNWLVATCECPKNHVVVVLNGTIRFFQHHEKPYKAHYSDPLKYAENWAQAGPIIEREEMTIGNDDIDRNFNPIWSATLAQKGLPLGVNGMYAWYGLTPLIAAMRCYVASKLGDEVEVPEKLL